MFQSNHDHRKALGEQLRRFRESRGLTRYRIAKNGDIPPQRVRDVENGDMNYTIDTFLGYIRGCGLHMYLTETEREPGDCV